MKEIFFKVTLLSDVVLNSKLATEGNMTTLDYIPGSNFLGIVAGKLYKNLESELAFNVFHSGKVIFGDATIITGNQLSYPMANMLFMDKLNKDIGKDDVYLDYKVDKENLPKGINGKTLQLKQQRGGYIFSDGTVLKELEKTFAIKSAQDRKSRTSKDGAMYGFESLIKGSEFVFSIQFKDESFIEIVCAAIVGNHRLGKSKNAEYGQIEIAKLAVDPNRISTFSDEEFTLVYAQSNLCFTDVNGVATFQPTAEQLGFENATIDWSKSQIRTHSYSPWNFKRNCNNTQRDCIAKGSVIYVNGLKPENDVNNVGVYQSEGLGRVIYNPDFLKADSSGKAVFNFMSNDTSKEKEVVTPINPKSLLAKFLKSQLEEVKSEKQTSDVVMKLVYSNENSIQKLKKITSSQWGGIRALATKIEDINDLSLKLFGKRNLRDINEIRDHETGYLTHGVADEQYWGKNRGANRKAFEKIFQENSKLGSQFIAKFAAEMAKESRKSNPKNN